MKRMLGLFSEFLTACVLLQTLCVSGEYPPHPYSAVWNSPTTQCFGKSLDLSRFAIMQNKNDAINGGNITVFANIGQFPTWGVLNATIVNGGLPQRGNLSLHLNMAEQDIKSLIPDPDFTGLAVIDFQAWKPLFRQNFDKLEIYQQQSMADVRKRHPDWNDTLVQSQAAKEFDEAARAFLEGTLQLAQKLRPKGLWGYMGYPYCNGYAGYYCDDVSTSENDMIQWLWNASSALYPVLFYDEADQGDDVISLVSVIHESHRIMANRTSLFLYLYTRYTYLDSPDTFYSRDRIQQSTVFANLFGVDGVVVMDSASHMTSKSFCTSLLTFITNTYGPITKSAYDEAVQCSNAQCNGRGQCVDKSEGLTLLGELEDIKAVADSSLSAWISWDCRCYHGWKGTDCKTPSEM